MLRIFKWLTRIFLVLAVVAIIATVVIYHFFSRSLPDYEAEYRVAGLGADLEIVRDTYGVPHIFGESADDVYFGLGYAHAQDRLWQMMLMRRTGEARLSEIFGERTFQTDDFLRRLDLYRLARADLAQQTPQARAALDAYARGVNARIRILNEEALGRGAPEFFLFEPQIAPWTAEDSLVILKLMALKLNSHLSEEILYTRAALLLPPERLRDLYAPDPKGARIALVDEMQSALEATPLAPEQANSSLIASLGNMPPVAQTAKAPFLFPLAPRGMGGASNIYAVHADKTAQGGTLLANDPHLSLSAPSIWYLARLGLPGNHAIGGTIPGIPAVILGRNEHIAWGLTASYIDDTDLFYEQLNPENPKEYLTPEGYKPFREEAVLIGIKDAPARPITLEWSENGPILPPTHASLGEITPADHRVALAWTALLPNDRSMSAAVNLMQATSLASAHQAARYFSAPAQNMMVAAKEGISWQIIGMIPKRNPLHEGQGRVPSRGWIETNRWEGVFAPEDNPRIVNPAGGVLGNANNQTVEGSFPNHVSFFWGDSQRIARLSHLMTRREIHTKSSMIEAQLDAVSPLARTALPLIGKDLWFTGSPAEAGSTEARRQQALQLLANWNGEMSEHLPEPLIYMAWMHALQIHLVQDELGPLTEAFSRPEPLFIERVFRDTEGAAIWCDVIQSTPKESCTEIASRALDTALIALSARYGNDPQSWRWGLAHQAHHDHEVLGEVPLFSWIVNIRHESSGGDQTLQRAKTALEGPEPYAGLSGSGYRAVYDLSNPDASVFIASTGQSGHFLSRFYDNFTPLWRRGEYLPMSLDPVIARAGAAGTTWLRPE